MNESIGRDRWRQTLTIAWRDGAFMLAGFTCSWHDTPDLANSGTCDVNLLNGKGELEKGPEENPTKTTLRTDMRAVPIADWAGDIAKECGLRQRLPGRAPRRAHFFVSGPCGPSGFAPLAKSSGSI